ncbi:hypothetical protein [Paenibacillus caui]|uniref:hypothetical protein n=1 Tax=Paenibacillus caui TaxID=2873927 RepID=UPI001CA9DA49|nr:hypothetical protein [Paenibacillus caui]
MVDFVTYMPENLKLSVIKEYSEAIRKSGTAESFPVKAINWGLHMGREKRDEFWLGGVEMGLKMLLFPVRREIPLVILSSLFGILTACLNLSRPILLGMIIGELTNGNSKGNLSILQQVSK